MPIPTPTGETEKDIDMSACIRALRKEGVTDSKQRVARCFSLWRKAHGKPEPENKE